MTIEAATKEYDALADDWSHGKPSHTDLCRMAGETALKHGIAATSDHEGNVRFQQEQTDPEERLARNFAIQLHFEMGEDRLAEAVARNNTPEYRNLGCATHDFCDANVPMFDAWLLTLGREIDFDSNADVTLWNNAWDRARAANFWCDRANMQQEELAEERLHELARALMATRPDLKEMSLDEWAAEHHDQLTDAERRAATAIIEMHEGIKPAG